MKTYRLTNTSMDFVPISVCCWLLESKCNSLNFWMLNMPGIDQWDLWEQEIAITFIRHRNNETKSDLFTCWIRKYNNSATNKFNILFPYGLRPVSLLGNGQWLLNHPITRTGRTRRAFKLRFSVDPMKRKNEVCRKKDWKILFDEKKIMWWLKWWEENTCNEIGTKILLIGTLVVCSQCKYYERCV